MCLYSFFHYNAFFILVGDFLTVVLLKSKHLEKMQNTEPCCKQAQEDVQLRNYFWK